MEHRPPQAKLWPMPSGPMDPGDVNHRDLKTHAHIVLRPQTGQCALIAIAGSPRSPNRCCYATPRKLLGENCPEEAITCACCPTCSASCCPTGCPNCACQRCHGLGSETSAGSRRASDHPRSSCPCLLLCGPWSWQSLSLRSRLTAPKIFCQLL